MKKIKLLLFNKNFVLKYNTLTYTFQERPHNIANYFISTKGLNEKRIIIEINWKEEDFLKFNGVVNLSYLKIAQH